MAGKINPSRRGTRSTRTRGGSPLGELLIKAGAIDNKQLKEALKLQENQRDLIGRILVGMGACDANAVAQALNKQFRVTGIELKDVALQPDALTLLDRQTCLDGRLVPFERIGNMLCVAMANVLQRKVIEQIQEETQLKIKPFSATWPEIQAAIDEAYPADAEVPWDDSEGAYEDSFQQEELAPAEGGFVHEDAPELPTPRPSAGPAASAPASATETDPNDPFAGDPTQWQRRSSRTSAIKSQMMQQRAGGTGGTPVPANAPAQTPSAEELRKVAAAAAAEQDSYAAPMYSGVKDLDLSQIDNIPTFSFASIDTLVVGDLDQAATEAVLTGEIPSNLPKADEIRAVIDKLPVAQVVARSRENLREMAAKEAELEAQLAALDGLDDEAEDVAEPAAPEPAVAEAPAPAEAAEPLDLASEDGPTGPLPAVEQAVSISDDEFARCTSDPESLDPVQDWELLVVRSGPLPAEPTG